MQRAEIQARFPLLGAAMQHEAAFGLHRTAVEYHAVADRPRHAQFGRGLFQHIAEVQAAGLIDHQSHGAVLVVLAEIDHGMGETGILHVWHGDQKVMLEIAR